MGAVNTIVRRNGKLIGHNTDYFGFSSMLQRSGVEVKGKKVLVLGSGGASVTAQKVLTEAGAQVIVISRSGENNYLNLHLHADASLIVNCTPVGMYPNNGQSPVDLSLFANLGGVLDMIYNPSRTQLLIDAKDRGIVAENGLWMLVAQGKESAEWFLGHALDDSCIQATHEILRSQMENIILIGMPGCGKSTVAALLGAETGRDVIDADEEIRRRAEMTIPKIFDRYGEHHFRALETEVLTSLGKSSGKIIATGGGCVTREENYLPLHQNGTIVWLQRSLDVLPKDGRPLSQKNNLEQMYRVRKPLYEKFADLTVCNDSTPEQAVQRILSLLNKE